MPAGRPLKFKSVNVLQTKITAYFKKCDKEKSPYLITGLANFLECDRDTLVNYQDKPEYFGTIKAAKQKCEEYAEKHIFTANNVTGAIFSLKNNYGWKDQQNIDHTSQGDKIGALSAEQSEQLLRARANRIASERDSQ